MRELKEKDLHFRLSLTELNNVWWRIVIHIYFWHYKASMSHYDSSYCCADPYKSDLSSLQCCFACLQFVIYLEQLLNTNEETHMDKPNNMKQSHHGQASKQGLTPKKKKKEKKTLYLSTRLHTHSENKDTCLPLPEENINFPAPSNSLFDQICFTRHYGAHQPQFVNKNKTRHQHWI